MSKKKDLILYINSLIDKEVEVTCTEITLDIDDIPTAVGPTESWKRMVHGFIITARELADEGLTPADVPNITVIEN